MIRKIFVALVLVSILFINHYCKYNKREKRDLVTSIVSKADDSTSYYNGRKLYGLYCLSCHNLAKNLMLLGITDSIPIDSFNRYVLKDSNNVYEKTEYREHQKFDTLTEKNALDIKHYLDKG